MEIIVGNFFHLTSQIANDRQFVFKFAENKFSTFVNRYVLSFSIIVALLCSDNFNGETIIKIVYCNFFAFFDYNHN